MKFSNFFIPTQKNIPAEAEIISHQLMIRSGMVKQSSAGIYSWLPLGLMVLRKIEKVVREEQNKAGAIELLMPTIQSADLWIKSGRYNDYGKEMLRIKDRSGREMLFGPTNEELITDIFKSYITTIFNMPVGILPPNFWNLVGSLRKSTSSDTSSFASSHPATSANVVLT